MNHIINDNIVKIMGRKHDLIIVSVITVVILSFMKNMNVCTILNGKNIDDNT